MREINIIGPLSNPLPVAEEIVETVTSENIVLDLSSGQLTKPSFLEKRTYLDEGASEGTLWINGQDFADTCAEPSRRAYIEWLAQLAEYSVAGGKSLKELFTYREGISLWWMTSSSVKHASKGPLRWLFYMVHVLEVVKDQYGEFESVHLWMPSEKMATFLESSMSSEVPCEFHITEESIGEVYSHVTERGRAQSISGRLLSGALNSSIGRSLHASYWLVRTCVRILLNVYHSRKGTGPATRKPEVNKSESECPTVLIETNLHSWVESGSEFGTLDAEQLDRYFGAIPWELEELGYEVAWMPTTGRKGARKKWVERSERQSLPDVLGCMQVRWSTAFKMLAEAWKWLGSYIWYFEVRSLESEWTYRGAHLGSWLRDEFRDLIARGALRKCHRIEQYRAAQREVQPDVVLYRNEFYTAGRLVSAALKGKTNLIGVQHGLIGHEHTVYQFHESEIQPISEDTIDHVTYCPVPDSFASFGERVVELFDEWNGYPAERVAPVGGLRHDSIVDKYGNMEPSERESVRKEFDLPRDRSVCVLCTGVRSELEPWVGMTARALQQVDEDVFLAVKLHQYHGGESLAQRALRSANFEAATILERGIYPLLAASDFMIGSASTTLLEAALLDTPAIALDIPAEYTYYDFSNGNIAPHVSTESGLVQEIERVLEGDTEERDVSRHMRNLGGERAAARLSELFPE